MCRMRLLLLLISNLDNVSTDTIFYAPGLPFNITWTTNDVHMTDILVGERLIGNCIPLFNEAHLYHREDVSAYNASISKDKTCVLTVKKLFEQESLIRIHSETEGLKAVLISSVHVPETNSSWAYARVKLAEMHEGESKWKYFLSFGIFGGVICIIICIRFLNKRKDKRVPKQDYYKKDRVRHPFIMREGVSKRTRMRGSIVR